MAKKPIDVSITEATRRGVSDVVRDAEKGIDIILTRHGKPVAAIISMNRLAKLDELERELSEAALEFARLSRRATVNSNR